jgi:hypothetical protein
MTHCFEDYSRPILPPVYVTTAPSLFQYMRPHPMPVYNPRSPQEECIPYACNIPYEKDQCYNFR